MSNYILKPYNNTINSIKNVFNLCKNKFFKGDPHKNFVDIPQITFLGATKTVTGSKYLLEYADKKIMIDCGLFQGSKEDRDKNRNQLPIFPTNIDAVILTHAHLDHTGYIPLLVKIYSTHATYELAKVILPDSGFLQEEDFRYAKKHDLDKLYDAEPLYTQEDAVNSLKSFKIVDYNQKVDLGSGVSFTIQNAGHILGAGVITVNLGNKKIVFSGDLGRKDDKILFDPTKLKEADYIVCESTYGDREHDKTDPKIELEEIINKTAERGGSVIIPAFAVGRCQLILYYIHQLKQEKRIPSIPVFVDSPMSIKVTHLLDDFVKEHKLSMDQCLDIYDDTRFTTTVEQSKRIFDYNFPSIIISASGMATGGRILHHLAHYAPDPKNSIVITGFQAQGTRGRYLVEGKKELKIHGEDVKVKAEVYSLSNMSAHADKSELLSWLSSFQTKPNTLFITHGEEKSAEAFARTVELELKWNAYVPSYLETKQL